MPNHRISDADYHVCDDDDGPRGYGDDASDRPSFVQHVDEYGTPLRQHGGYGPDRPTGHRGKGPRNHARSDAGLQAHVSELLTEHDEIDASNLDVHVADGAITLTGTLDDGHMRGKLDELLGGIAGVRAIHMSIAVRGVPTRTA